MHTSPRASPHEMEHLVRALSHDMAANLMLLDNSYQQVTRAAEQAANDAISEGLTHLGACLRQSQRFLDDLVTLARTGAVQMEPQVINLRGLIGEVLFEQRELIADRQAIIEVADDLPQVWCHPSRAKQVLTNILRNALKHGCDRFEPRIQISHLSSTQETAWIRIHDNGPGIPPEMCEEVFLPGCRLASADAEGSGMGLSIVKKIIEHYGGRVHIDVDGQGTAVVFSLPRHQ